MSSLYLAVLLSNLSDGFLIPWVNLVPKFVDEFLELFGSLAFRLKQSEQGMDNLFQFGEVVDLSKFVCDTPTHVVELREGFRVAATLPFLRENPEVEVV